MGIFLKFDLSRSLKVKGHDAKRKFIYYFMPQIYGFQDISIFVILDNSAVKNDTNFWKKNKVQHKLFFFLNNVPRVNLNQILVTATNKL